jgi:hypothetical protein
MKRSVLIIVALCATLLLVAVLPVAASTRNRFRGNWRGIDAFDGSNLRLQIVEESRSGGKVFELRASDDRTGQWCGGPAQMRAIGVLEGENSIAVSMVWWCLPAGSNVLYFYPDTYSYDLSTDTITSTDGTVYQRGR